MKLVKTLVTGAAFRSLSFGRESVKEDYKKLELEKPLNWIASSRLFPANVIAGFNSELSQYDAEGWADYILGQCKQFSACTSTSSFQATNSGSGGRFWFGYVFRGGPTTTEDYEREEGVEDSIIYTMSYDDDDGLHVQGADL